MGGKISSFVSFCGGLPAPEASANALRYKFSWSPKAVLLALMNPARYLMNGREIHIEGNGGVLDDLYPVDFMPGFNLVGYANRDSIKYADIYGVAKECNTLLRGTLRYNGFAEAIRALKTVGLLSVDRKEIFNPMQGPDLTWKQIIAILNNQGPDIFTDSLRKIVSDKFGANKVENKLK
jgi:alpha-aminoadipic semialdehyde synthase